MPQKNFLFLFVFTLTFLLGAHAHALDPVAPRSERQFGTLFVKTPLPESDRCEIVGIKENPQDKKVFSLSFKPLETVKVPVGEYLLKVKLQELEWSKSITVQPTERTDIEVVGYGNLKVKTPHPSTDQVELYSASGKLVKKFHPTQAVTVPTGIYKVKVDMGVTSITQENVMIVTNTTRELSADYE